MKSIFNNIEKEYNASISTTIEIEGIYILLLRRTHNVRFNNNIIAVNPSGNVLWQIEEVYEGYLYDAPYMNIWIDENNRIQAYNWIGMEYFVNITNGRITRAREGRLW